jgi:hypothetical protein
MKIKELVAVLIFFHGLSTIQNSYAKTLTRQIAGTKIYDLRCQYLRHPIGIGESHPSFSWKLSSIEQSVVQVAYQIVVASSLKKLRTQPDIWNSGKTKSDKNTFIHYEGKPLRGAKKYYWKVKIWTNKGQKSFTSKSAYFVTALLQENEWNDAKWIAYQALPDSMKVFPGVPGGSQLGDKAKKRDVIPYFRKAFSINKKIAYAYVFVSGLGQYVLFLNGKRIDKSSFINPAWSDYTKHIYYNSYDVTHLLKEGKNVIGSIVGNGFLYINRERYHKLIIADGYPMLRLKLIIHFTNGSKKEIVTDESWETAPSAITYSSVYGGENFDANKIQKSWNQPGFNDKNWKSAVIIAGPGGKMDAQGSYPVVINKKFHPVKVDSAKSTYRMYDFGQNVSGIIRIKASAPKGYTIRIIPAELINKDHTPDQSASGYPYYWQYTFSGNGIEEWQPLFSYYGFRYAGIKVFDSKGERVNIDSVNIRSITSLHTQNGAPKVGTFSSSDTLFNKIFKLIRWGIRNNLSNVATDCPHREKLGWLEETHLMGSSIQYNYGIFRFYNKITKDMIVAQLSNGLVPDIAPEYVVFADGFRDSPAWGSASILDPWYVYKWYGDKRILKKSYVMMKRYVFYLSSKDKNKDHLLAYGLGDWYDLGPKLPGVSQLTPVGVVSTAFYYYDAKILSRVATVLHRPDDAQKFSALSDSIRQAFNGKYFNSQLKVYATGSQTSYAIPLYFGIAPKKYRGKILKNLVDSITANNYDLTSGEIGFRPLIKVLENGGYNDVIYKMNNRSDVPGYGYQIKKGATALTESWRALRNRSNDHMMLGDLMEWFYSGLGGIRQQEGSVGYKKILIEPQFVNGIKWVDCSYHSINGLIAVKWKRMSDGKIRLKVKVPANASAKVVFHDKIKVIGSGNYTFYFNENI